MKTLILLLAVIPLLEGAHIDLSAFPFGTTLRLDESSGEPIYQVFWDFDAETETSQFAVRARTAGWVGFGLSPDGGMIGSDVVIGWVDGANVFFHDRYADAQAPPPIDASQDWTLVAGEEEDGYTILQFTRPWITCDDRDRNIEANTARVVYSWNTVDPADANSVMYHGFTQRGSASINLLGGQRETVPDPVDVESFTIAVTDVVIPDDVDTTYWCYATQLPQEVRDTQRYVTRFSPKITSNSFNFVHHMLVYLCELDAADIETQGICFSGDVGGSVNECTSSQLIAAWAVGGEDFVYPENVAFPIGGPGNQFGIVLEMHYDNPGLTSGVLDSSGIEFFYTSTPRQDDAGILFLGHTVVYTMVIPPNAADYSILGVCSPTCTAEYFPEEGIHIFANMLHTHLVGHGLVVQHIRENEQCNMTEELRPIDENLQYDFNYQQITHLEETTVLPGDTILLKCLYTTTGVRSVPTFGGLATTDEMCLSFLVYYPRTNLTVCDSRPTATAYNSFITNYLTPEEQMLFIGFDGSEGQFRDVLGQIDWTDQKVQGLESSLQNTLVGERCVDEDGQEFNQEVPYPDIQCEYQSADVCTGFEPTPCCERGTTPTTDATGATTMATTVATPATDPIDLSGYPFSSVLRVDGSGETLYELFWDFDREAETITFAVRARTTGWVGFGLSPNGGMIGSDVIIGWVTENSVFFHDRYADDQVLPPIDQSQDWSLLRGQEVDGHTVLEFTRSWVTCDNRDRDIADNTARVVYSWHSNDPADADSAMYHTQTQRGAVSLNLLGGQRELPPDPSDLQSFTVAVNNVNIPADDTTYWCAATQLPLEVQEQERYITRFSPRITDNDFELVHHMLIFICDLDETDVGRQGICFSGGLGDRIDECTSSQLIGAWAVGGEDFVYPENVAFPIGGPGSQRHLVIEMHYDNPDLRNDIVDSSGIEFFYTSGRREHDAGIMNVGHFVQNIMVIPPNAANYTIIGQCSPECTSEYLPNEGIKVFANILHTHLVGTGLTLQRIRQNQQCDMTEELRPIDKNLQYDFDYQQFTYFSEEITVLPGDTLLLNCFYTTTGERDGVTLGGLATTDEMCLSFLVYYPRTGLTVCQSTPILEAFGPFVTNFVPENVSLLSDGSTGGIRNALNQLEWTNDQVQGLEQTLVNGPLATFCVGDNGFSSQEMNSHPDIQCGYQAPDPCNPSNTPVDCCDRGGAPTLAANVLFVVTLFAVACVLF